MVSWPLASPYSLAAFTSFVGGGGGGGGIPPVTSKLVAAIISGEFIVFALLLEDHVDLDAPSFSLVAVIRPAKRRKEITVILTWMQAFLVYTLGFNDLLACSYYYMKYPLLIMRSAQQYAGSTWLFYVRAFRRQAAACHQTDSSYMNSELYYIRVLGCRRRRELTFRVHRWQRFLSLILVPNGDSGRRGLGSA